METTETRTRGPVPSETVAAPCCAKAVPETTLTIRQLHQVLDASPESVVCIDRDWRCTFVNLAARTILQSDDLVGADLWTRFPQNQQEPFASNYRAAMEQRVPTDFEAYYPEPLDIWFKVSARPYEGGIIIFSSNITARKQAELFRDRNAQLLEQVLEATTDGIVSLDRDFNYTLVNRQAELLLGRDDLLGKNMWREFASTEADTPLRQTMEDRVGRKFEVFNPAPLNRWFNVQTRPSDGGIVVFFTDITEERATQQTLLARQATLAFVQQTARVATWDIDLATHSMTVSEGSFPVWGRSVAEVKTLDDFYSIVHPDDRQLLMQRHRTASAGKTLDAVDYRMISLTGEVLWVEGRVLPVFNHLGVATHLRGLTMDITARKNVEALRDAATRQLAQVLDATTNAVVSLDRDWTITFVNPQGRRMLHRDDLVGKNVWQEFPADVDSQIYRRYHETMETGRPCEFEEYYPEPLDLWVAVQCRASADGIVVFSHSTTEEHQAREKLLEQQATLAFVQQTALVATWVIHLGTGAMTITEGSFPVFGVPNEQIQTIADFRRAVLPEDLPLVGKRTQEVVARGGVATVDYRVAAVDGSVRWLEGRAIAEHNEHGAATHLRGMTTDITARKQEEQKLRASEERYRVLADLNPQTLWIGEPDGRISYTNQGHAEYRGVEMEDLLGSRWADSFHPDDKAPAMKAWAHSVATGEEYAIEARIRNSEGEFRWWVSRALPVRDEAGNILNWLGVAHDIDDMKQVAETLRRKQQETERQRAELEAIYENAPLGLALFDPVEFRWLRLNEAQAEIFGMKKEELLNTRLFDLVKIEGVRQLFEQVAQGVPVLDQLVEGELPSRPGEKRIWRVSYLPIFAPDGSVEAIIASALEITREKKAEAALVQSEKLAAVGRLASSISHEINNPLEAITNLLYLVSTDPHLHEEVKVYVSMAQSEITRVSQITTQTLRFHRQSMKPTLITAEELVGSVLGLYQGRLGNSGIRIEATYASKTLVFCFENDLRQVLNNLIANAIDAMRNGGRLIVRAHDITDWVSARDGAAAQKGIRITVADTGHGMSQAVVARVFEPFYTTKDLNGTGLGLWISAGIVQNHRGRLTVRSSQAPGHAGTVFTLFLPLGEETV